MKAIYIIIGIIIIILLSLDIWKRTDSPDSEFDEQVYRDSLQVFQNQINQIDSVKTTLLYQNDSLRSLKPKVKHYYHEKLIFITGFSTNQLDSLILTNIE